MMPSPGGFTPAEATPLSSLSRPIQSGPHLLSPPCPPPLPSLLRPCHSSTHWACLSPVLCPLSGSGHRPSLLLSCIPLSRSSSGFPCSSPAALHQPPWWAAWARPLSAGVTQSWFPFSSPAALASGISSRMLNLSPSQAVLQNCLHPRQDVPQTTQTPPGQTESTVSIPPQSAPPSGCPSKRRGRRHSLMLWGTFWNLLSL